MPLVKAICETCGGQLEVDNSLEAAVCPYCRTPYIVEKAIKNYNISNNGPTYINNATFTEDSEFIRLLDAAEGYEKLGDYANAYKSYVEICRQYPHKFEGWYGTWIISLEIELYHREISDKRQYVLQLGVGEEIFHLGKEDLYDTLDSKLYKNAKKLADSDQRVELEKAYDRYEREIGKIVEERKSAYNSRFGTFSELVAYLGTNNIHLRNTIGNADWNEIYRKGNALVLVYTEHNGYYGEETLREEHLITGYSARTCKFRMPKSNIELYAEDYSSDNLFGDYSVGSNIAHFVFLMIDVDGNKRMLFFDEAPGRSSKASGIRLPRFFFRK